VSQYAVGLSVVQYSDTSQVVIPLSAGYVFNRRQLQQLVLNLPFRGGRSNLAGALDTVRTVALSSDVARVGTSLVAVVVTDHLVWTDSLAQSVSQLQQAGVTIVGVGITAIPGALNQLDMIKLVTNNQSWIVANYSLLYTVINSVVYSSCIPLPSATAGRKYGYRRNIQFTPTGSRRYHFPYRAINPS
jgi:hypothetical protein